MERIRSFSKRARGTAQFTIDDLLEIMRILRAPESGCPWDLQQSFETIAPYTIEEAYEVAEAIELKDMEALKGELGDLLFQSVYHAQMADEIEAFKFADIVDGISRKMIRRHPHIFGDEKISSPEEMEKLWARVKEEERLVGDPAQANAPAAVSEPLLASVTATLPALMRARKLQERAAAVGFDWPDLAPVLEKLYEEMGELEEVIEGDRRNREIESQPPSPEVQARTQRLLLEEYGDLLFVMVNLGRHLKLDPEIALRAANQKFIDRFGRIEELLATEGLKVDQSNLEEMDRLWEVAKREEREREKSAGHIKK